MHLLLLGLRAGVLSFYEPTGEIRFHGLMHSTAGTPADWINTLNIIGRELVEKAIDATSLGTFHCGASLRDGSICRRETKVMDRWTGRWVCLEHAPERYIREGLFGAEAAARLAAAKGQPGRMYIGNECYNRPCDVMVSPLPPDSDVRLPAPGGGEVGS